jgi:hypothetical protein
MKTKVQNKALHRLRPFVVQPLQDLSLLPVEGLLTETAQRP